MNMTNEQQQTPAQNAPFNTPPPAAHQSHVIGMRWQGQPGVVADPRRKYPLLAIVLSALPGLGQVYVGYYQFGITLIVIAGSLTTLASNVRYFGLQMFEPLLVLSMIFTWMFSCVDAGRRASLYNQALAGLRPMDLPENQQTPEWQGSIIGGAALVVVGAVLFLHTMFGVPMDWLVRWWPLALVGTGAWLLYASVRSRQAEAAPSVPSSPDSTDFDA